MHVKVSGQWAGVTSLLPPWGPSDQTQVVRLGSNCLYQLSNLNGPSVFLNSLAIYLWLSWSSLYSQDYLEPAVILLPQILKCWDYKREPPFLARLLVF